MDLLIVGIFGATMVNRNEKAQYDALRASMVASQLMTRSITDSAVLEVMGEIPREEFVPRRYKDMSYEDTPLPIGMGQTISQPYMVALMTQLLDCDKSCDVLEIGTGSGYQTAILAKLAKRVYTVEVHSQLLEGAQSVLGRLGIENVEYYVGDGSCGWPEEREFGRIIVAAASPEVPESLRNQLADGGKLAIPVGKGDLQQLLVIKRRGDDYLKEEYCWCRFVKLVGEEGFGWDLQ